MTMPVLLSTKNVPLDKRLGRVINGSDGEQVSISRRDMLSGELVGSRNTKTLRVCLLVVLSTVGMMVVFFSSWTAATAHPQTAAEPQQSAGYDDLQRSLLFYKYDLAAFHGPARGEVLYYFKCWMCHNKYTKSAPYLKDIFRRDTLNSGQPVNDDTVSAQIKNGSPDMPSFGTMLSDSDLRDLLAYLHDDKCCLEGEDPPKNPLYLASTHKWPVQTELSGGATGAVKIPDAESVEGIRVQLVAPNGVRTTVYTNAAGRYEFPRMEPGEYIQRVATPIEFKPYRRSVRIDGAAKLDDIHLERTSNTEDLPPTSDVEGQLSGSELLWNLPGSAAEKLAFARQCGPGCHSYQQIFRNRYDERSWGLIVHRMVHYGPATLILPHVERQESVEGPPPASQQSEEMIVKWLARVRGPESKDGPIQPFPRPQGQSTRVVITEFEVPRVLLSLHDVAGDPQGNIWFTSHKSRIFGKLDPHTGFVTEFQTSLWPGAMPGTHRVAASKDGTIWISEPWSHRLMHFDPHSGGMKEFELEGQMRMNDVILHNFALAPDGSIWNTFGGEVQQLDPETAKVVKRYPLNEPRTYDNLISSDGTLWAGGSPGVGNTAHFLNIRTGVVTNFSTGVRQSSLSRGGFDPSDNAWFGTRSGTFAEINTTRKTLNEFYPPTPLFPYTDFYEAMPDKNGEIWGGLLHGPGFVRYNPRTDRWVTYNMAEPSAFDRRTWIDNSTNPVTIWYVDYQGYIVRIQPLN